MASYFEIIGESMGEQLACLEFDPTAKPLGDAILPIVARGNNAVMVVPPSATYAVPALAGVYHHLKEGTGLRGLVLVPTGTISAWTGIAASLPGSLKIHVGEGQARAARLLSAGAIDVLVTTLATAIALQQRATLKVDALRSVVLVWPELWSTGDTLATLMTDAKEAQRVVLTTDPAAVTDLVERYARKAITIGGPSADQTAALPLGPVRTVSVAESDRATAVRGILEVLDPASVAIWAADASSLARAVGAASTAGQPIESTTGDVSTAKTVIAWDVPTHARLQQLLTAGEVVLLLPPHAEGWAATNLRDRRPLLLPGAVDGARDDAARRRTQVNDLLSAGLPTEGLLALAPLFERYDATLIAAALYQLAKASAPVSSVASATLALPIATGTMWVGAGSTDGVQPKDIVGALVNEIKVDRASIGKVDVREKFTLVELPAADVARISQAFTGTTIRRKRVLARPERPRESRPARGGSDRPSRGPRTERPPRRHD